MTIAVKMKRKVWVITTAIWVIVFLCILLLLGIGGYVGYMYGSDEGARAGYKSGVLIGQLSGYKSGYQDGLTDGQNQGYHKGYLDGRHDGVQVGIIQQECFIARNHPQANAFLGHTC